VNQSPARSNDGFNALRQFVRRTSGPAEYCELCRMRLATVHQHLLEPISRKLVCACDACAILFMNQGTTKFKRVPRRIRVLADFELTDAQWDSLSMPINMAFFFRSSPQNRIVALYPSPAGATESLLSLDAWDDIARKNPALADMEPDVEALLANRLGHSRGFNQPEYYVAPIDECFRLVGLIRTHWRGLSGGTDVWREMGQFFTELKSKAITEQPHA
jgi:hypothetical protein